MDGVFGAQQFRHEITVKRDFFINFFINLVRAGIAFGSI
jgi:hypothetical protein